MQTHIFILKTILAKYFGMSISQSFGDTQPQKIKRPFQNDLSFSEFTMRFIL